MASYNYSNLPFGVPYHNTQDGTSPMATPEPHQADDAPSGDSPTTDSGSHPRKCSVRGCMTAIPSDRSNKMCEACRGRHRVYAMTKRAKRKLEKEALVQQSVALLSTEQPPGTVWLPEAPELDDDEAGPWVQRPDTSPEPVASTSNGNTTIPETYSASHSGTWDHSVIDPILASSQSSELAGALTLPSTRPLDMEPSPSEEGMENHDQDVDAPYIAPVQNSDNSHASSRPGRPCSVKGCKATIPADYFFKMCEPCRDRYRGYGITKRAKWRAERIAANAELDALRVEEDKRRAEEGLPPLEECPEDWITWQNDLVDGPLLTSTEDKHGPFPSRMCTVSHCHVVLSGEYKYRRCEQHRLQNRHHSKLKRVREKEVKAQATALAESEDAFRIWAPRELPAKKKDEEPGPLFTRTPMEIDRTPEDESEELSAEIPVRRKNHVCSIKGCYNLLAPDIPWKMCDICREHDRQNRKNKKLRELGRLPPLRNRVPSAIPKRVKKKNLAASQASSMSIFSVEPVPLPVSAQASSSKDANEASDEPMHPAESTSEDVTTHAPEENPDNLQQNEPTVPLVSAVNTTNVAPPAGATSSDNLPVVTDTSSTTPEDPRPSKKRGKYKPRKPRGTNPAPNTSDAPLEANVPAPPQIIFVSTPAPTPSGQTHAPIPSTSTASVTAPVPYPHPYPPHGQPPYPVPYYMHPPYYNMSMQPPGSMSAPPAPASAIPAPASQAGTSSTAAFPVQMYPYPPYGYPPYTSRPYGQYTYPYVPPPYSASQPPYGMHPGQPPYAYGPPPAPPPPPIPAKPKIIKPIQRRQYRKLDEVLPGPDGSSFTSVFSARPEPTPTLRSIPPSELVPNAENARPTPEPAQEANGADILMAEPEISPTHAALRPCVNQSCRRTIPAGTSGNICERCRRRVKKRQATAKQRYKLEPRLSLARLAAR